MACVVKKNASKQWMWIAMDAKSCQVIVFHVGNRGHTSAIRLWAKIPEAYRQHATLYMDQCVVYGGVIPSTPHKALGKLTRKSNCLERFNNTLQPRVS